MAKVQRLRLAMIKRSDDKLALKGAAERRPWTSTSHRLAMHDDEGRQIG
jgi:hypothetical protein